MQTNSRVRSGALALVVCLVGSSVPMPASAAGMDREGIVTGFAATTAANPLANHPVRLRNVDWGQVAAIASTDRAGSYAFAGLVPGNYIVELMDATGVVIGTSTPISVSTGRPTVNGVLVTASATNGAGQAPVAGGGNFFTSTAGKTVMVAAAAGVTGIYMATRNTKNASPSR